MITGRIYKVTRNKGIAEHVGLLVEGWGVFHNSPGKGEHVSSLQEFADGKEVRFFEVQGMEPFTVIARINKMLEAPQPYSPFYNCEHTISKVLTGDAESPQLQNALAGLCLLMLVIGISRA